MFAWACRRRWEFSGIPLIANKDDLWVLAPTKDDLLAGAQYAAVSLPWTFNRMMKNTGSRGQQERALNIAKGIVGQELLGRAMREHGVSATSQRKSHRDEDLFDFHVEIGGQTLDLDVKTWHYFTDYKPLGRSPLSTDLLVEHADYSDADWSRFFPMLVPHTQIGQSKECYCFALASSIDPRRENDINRTEMRLAAFPYGELLPFLSSKKLCAVREDSEAGFWLELTWRPDGMFAPTKMEITVVGEWAGKLCQVQAVTTRGKTTKVGPFSCVASFAISPESYEAWGDGVIAVRVGKNDCRVPVLNTARRDVNRKPAEALMFARDDICNLVLPDDYRLYVLGWMPKTEYIDRCRAYPGWVWPMNSEDRTRNQAWSMITESDMKSLTRAGFDDCVKRKPTRLEAGWMKTTGRGGGACCYVYPNLGGGRGGVRETNLYCLLQDVHTMMSIESMAE